MSKERIGYRIYNGFEPYIEGVAECDGLVKGSGEYVNLLRKQGKNVIFNFFDGMIPNDYVTLSGDKEYNVTITLPEEFRPKETIGIPVLYGLSNLSVGLYDYRYLLLNVGADGIIKINFSTALGGTGVGAIRIVNAGWETA